MSKGPDAFRTISEVAEELELPQHVLRFWETRFAQIKPLKRGGGRRYYRPDDVDLLRGIRQLLYGEGYTIRGVQRILHDQGLRFVVAAGKGELAGLEALAPATGNGNARGNGHAPDVQPPVSPAGDESDDGDDAIEPAFDPREFRPASPEPHAVVGDHPHLEVERLTASEMHRLKSTLSELLELKRLLDQVR